MAFKCYKKLVPQNPVRLSGNASIKFKTFDQVWGYYATQDPNIQAQLGDSIQQGQFGMSEISEAEFHEFLEKKSKPSPPVWREEFSPGRVSKLLLESEFIATAAAAAAVNTPKPPLPAASTITAPLLSDPATVPAKPPVTPDFSPPIGRRVSARRKGIEPKAD